MRRLQNQLKSNTNLNLCWRYYFDARYALELLAHKEQTLPHIALVKHDRARLGDCPNA